MQGSTYKEKNIVYLIKLIDTCDRSSQENYFVTTKESLCRCGCVGKNIR